MAEKVELKMKLSAWRKKHRYTLQAAALILGVLAPFGIFFSLQGGLAWLGALFFGLLAAAMLLTAWAG
jgi:hypothetical protein